MKSIRIPLVSMALVALTYSGTARAEPLLLGAGLQLGTGIESGGKFMQRSRTRLRLPFEFRIDEGREEGVVVAGLVDIEPRAAAGADVRYMHLLDKRLAVTGGGVGFLVPATLFGATAGVETRFTIGSRVSLTAGPDFTVFFLGSDLPNNQVLWQALLQAGFRADL